MKKNAIFPFSSTLIVAALLLFASPVFCDAQAPTSAPPSIPAPPTALPPETVPPPQLRANTFRSKLLTAIQQAPEGLPTPQIRDMFPDQKQSTLAGALSKLRRYGLVRSESGMWFPVERTEPVDAGLEEEETAPIPDAMASNEVDQDLLKAAP